MKMGYLPKLAGPREEELLASISTPTRAFVESDVDFSVLKANRASGAV